jgi:putative membrane protein
MMNGYNNMDGSGWIVMVAIWATLLGVIVWAVLRIVPALGGGTRHDTGERPAEILDRRLARGEIDTDTYDRLRAKLVDGKPTS